MLGRKKCRNETIHPPFSFPARPRMNETIARTIGIEVRKTLQQEYGVLGSIAEKGKRGSINSPSTPIIPEVDIKAEITKDLEYNDFESAFTKVLASSDLSSVLYLCSKVSPKQVFTGSAVLLSQPGTVFRVRDPYYPPSDTQSSSPSM